MNWKDNMVKAAILLDDLSLERWQMDALGMMIQNTPTEIDLVIINKTDKESTSTFKDHLKNLSAWKIYVGWRFILKKIRDEEKFKENIDLDDIDFLQGADYLFCSPTNADGLGKKLPPRIVAKLENCDIAIRFGFGIIVGETLSAPKYGVLSYHHGDIRKYRGRPAGFWEFLKGEDKAGITLQRLTEKLDAGEIVAFKKVNISDEGSWPETRKKLFEYSVPLLAKGVENILTENFSPKKADQLGKLYTLPGLRGIIKYVCRCIISK